MDGHMNELLERSEEGLEQDAVLHGSVRGVGEFLGQCLSVGNSQANRFFALCLRKGPGLD